METRAYLLLVEDLHGIVVAGVFVLHEHHSTERTRSQRLYSVEVVQSGCVLQETRIATRRDYTR